RSIAATFRPANIANSASSLAKGKPRLTPGFLALGPGDLDRAAWTVFSHAPHSAHDDERQPEQKGHRSLVVVVSRCNNARQRGCVATELCDRCRANRNGTFSVWRGAPQPKPKNLQNSGNSARGERKSFALC